MCEKGATRRGGLDRARRECVCGQREVETFLGLHLSLLIETIHSFLTPASCGNLWPPRLLAHRGIFFDKFPDTRVILDGTECPVKQPTQPVTQQATFSSYKRIIGLGKTYKILT